MSGQKDDLQAVRTIVEALEGFEKSEQERIIRWAREKVGLDQPLAAPLSPSPAYPPSEGAPVVSTAAGTIKDFIEKKNPVKDIHFAAAVAYYYQFELPVGSRKDSIGSDDLQEACRLSNRKRFTGAITVLHNAEKAGLLDKLGGGQFKINAVGENLVAMGMPAAGISRVRKITSKKNSTRKKSSRKNG